METQRDHPLSKTITKVYLGETRVVTHREKERHESRVKSVSF